MNEKDLIEITGLRTVLPLKDGTEAAPVDGIDLAIPRGKTVGLVGESGCGKSMTARSIMRLLDAPIHIQSGTILYDGQDLAALPEKEMRRIRGNKISMIFQEPMTALNPSITVGKQVREAILLHEKVSPAQAKAMVLESFRSVGIPEPERRYRAYPHQLSGGLRQRICIAMAMVLKPEFLIADEPTTALDVTVEAQILALMKELQKISAMSTLTITHNLGVVADICDEVNVMYAGQIVEHADKRELFRDTRHPYTQGLMRAIPRISGDTENMLYSIRGTVPPLNRMPAGCRFCDRTQAASEAPKGDDTLRAITLVASETFNPLVAGNGDKPVYHALFDCLFRFDNDGNVIPMLAESWEEDGLEVTLHLRQDAYLTDGNPVTAKDVVFSYNTVLEDPTLRYNMTLFSTGMEVVDDYTISLHLNSTSCKWENILAELLYIVEEAAYDPSADFTTTAPVGSGPYTLAGVDAARKVTLTANENYWAGAPEFKIVEVSAAVNDATALIALQTGEVDLVAQVGLATFTQAQSDPNLVPVAFDSWSNEGMMVMVGDDAFRQTIFHAIDRDTILAICNDGNGSANTDMFSSKVMEEYAGVAPFTGYDLDLAKECIANTTMDLSKPYTVQTFDAASAAVAQCIQQDLAAIGITLEISQVDANTFFDNMMSGNMEMGLVAMGTDMVTAEQMLSMLDPNAGYPFNISATLIEMAQTAPYITDDAERYAAVTEALKQMTVECPWVPLYDTPMYMIHSARVGNVIASSAGTYAFYFGDMTIEG